MTTQLISYDLSAPGRNYERLFDKIKEIGTWWHCLESVWIIETTKSASEVRDALTPFLDSNDKVVVLKLEGAWASLHLSKECNDWLRTHVSRTPVTQKY